MSPAGRNNKIGRRSLLFGSLGLPLFRAVAAERLGVSFDGDNLHIAAPSLHFLTGKALTRLRNADTVVFFSQLTLFSDNRGTIFRQARERLVVSYDLWEERFAVVIPGTSRTKPHMTARQAESWCMENLAISALGMAPDRPFWLRFELRAASQRDLSSVVGESGISLSMMVDVLSRKPGADDLYSTLSAGPLRLADLPRTLNRGA